MRIISGFFKGKKILKPKDNKTRPLKDLVKESIFNIIIHSHKLNIKLTNSNILDLFSGVGSFGIECLSRGVKKVVFVENHHNVLPILRKNLLSLKSVQNYKIIERDVENFNSFLDINNKFNLIFLDPPFKYKDLSNLLYEILNKKLLYKNGTIIIHRHKDEVDNYPINFKIIEKKIYGLSKILFLSRLD